MGDPIADQDYATKKYHDDNLPFFGVGHPTDTLIFSNDIGQEAYSTSYVKAKEIICYRNLRNVRLKWEYAPSGGTAYTKIYINGVAVGIEHSETEQVYHLVSEDFSDIGCNDLIQLYAKSSTGACVQIKNMRIYYDDEFISNDP